MSSRRLQISLLLALAVATLAVPTVEAAVSESDDVADTTRRFVFVYNRLDARSVALASVRNAMERFVAEELRAGDEVMVVEIGYSTRVLQGFPSSKDATLETIRGLRALPINTFTRLQTRQVYDSLRGIAEEVESLAGPKFVILASVEPNRTREGKHYIADTVDALNRANAMVYSIDLDVLHRPFFRRQGVSGLSGLGLETGGRHFLTASRFGFAQPLRDIAAAASIAGSD